MSKAFLPKGCRDLFSESGFTNSPLPEIYLWKRLINFKVGDKNAVYF